MFYLPQLLSVEVETESIEEATEEVTKYIDIPTVEESTEKVNAFVEKLRDFVPALINFGIKLLIAFVILLIGRFLIKMILKISKRFFDRTKLDVGVSKFLLSLIRTVCYIVLVLIMLETVGIKTTSFIALLTTSSLAIGLALQGSLSNFAGGILILIIKPFKIGDYISCSSAGLEGSVSKIDLFYTTLITADNKVVVIPNGVLSNSSLTNMTALETRRVDFTIGISYDSDIKKAKEVLEKCAKEHEKVLKDKEIFCYVSSLDSSQVTLGVRIWAKTDDYWTVLFDLKEKAKVSLDESGIEIPFNQIVVHTEENK